MDQNYYKQWSLTIGILLLLGMVTAYDVYMDRRKTESVEQDRLLVQTRVIDDNLNHQLVATYMSMDRIVGDLPYWRAGNSYKPVANLMLKTIEEAMPGVRTLLVIDAQGIARASSRPELIGQDLSHREYFQTVRLHPDPSTLFLSPPYHTVLNIYAMNVSRMVSGPNGKFNGIIVATLDPEYFRTLLASCNTLPTCGLPLRTERAYNSSWSLTGQANRARIWPSPARSSACTGKAAKAKASCPAPCTQQGKSA